VFTVTPLTFRFMVFHAGGQAGVKRNRKLHILHDFYITNWPLPRPPQRGPPGSSEPRMSLIVCLVFHRQDTSTCFCLLLGLHYGAGQAATGVRSIKWVGSPHGVQAASGSEKEVVSPAIDAFLPFDRITHP
jgi:hypothetical protein